MTVSNETKREYDLEVTYFVFIGSEFPPNVNGAKILYLDMRVNAKFEILENHR